MIQATCTPCTFSTLLIPGATVHTTTAEVVLNHTTFTPRFSNPNHDYIPPTQVDFCNVTIAYTHTGYNESILTRIYLPINSWNGRLQGVGGGGFIAGLQEPLIAFDGAIAEGYTAVGTSAGFYTSDVYGGDANTWALPTPGKVDMHRVEDFAYRSLADMVMIGKKAVKNFYGEAPKYSYFSGCSGGGRQGYLYAQRYPDAWNGIAACAPGIYWDQLPDQFWAQLLMNVEGAYPWPCELVHLRSEASAACDELDGVKDGVMQDPDACTFEPQPLLGKSIECPEAGGLVNVSEIAVQIADMTWKNKKLSGVNTLMPTSGYDTMLTYLAHTICTNSTCIGDPNPLSVNWMRIFVEKNMSWDPKRIKSFAEFEALRERSVREYQSVLGIKNYSLSEFRDAGGKMITYQGMVSSRWQVRNSFRNVLIK